MNLLKKYKSLILKIFVSAFIFAFIYYKVDKEAFVSNIKLVDLSFAPLIILFLVLNYVVSSYRWKALLIYKNTESISVSYLTSLYFVGSYFNNFMPTSVGGDVYKIYKLGKKIKSPTNAFSATFMERFTGVLILALISMLSLVGILKYWIILLFLWFAIGFYVGIMLLRFFSNKIKIVKKIYDSLCKYKGERKVIFWAIATSFIVQLLAILTQYTVFLSLGQSLPIVYSLLVFPIITLAGFFIPSLNGIGVQDALYMSAFSLVGVSPELSLSASILYHLFRLGVSLIGGVLYVMGKAD